MSESYWPEGVLYGPARAIKVEKRTPHSVTYRGFRFYGDIGLPLRGEHDHALTFEDRGHPAVVNRDDLSDWPPPCAVGLVQKRGGRRD